MTSIKTEQHYSHALCYRWDYPVTPPSDASSKSALNTNGAEVADENLVKLG